MEAEETNEEKPNEVLSGKEREERFGQYDHVRIYGRDYFKRLQNVGFKVQHIGFSPQLIQKLALEPKDEIIISIK